MVQNEKENPLLRREKNTFSFSLAHSNEHDGVRRSPFWLENSFFFYQDLLRGWRRRKPATPAVFWRKRNASVASDAVVVLHTNVISM